MENAHNDFYIRAGTAQDLPRVLELIQELAEFEREPDAVETTVESMWEDAFGRQPVFGFLVAELNSHIEGVAVYYYRYSTWRGKCLYLEDLIVTKAHRGKGMGAALFDATVRQAAIDGCMGLSWQVLDWNEPAIEFYRRRNAKMESQWINCSFTRSQILDWVATPSIE